MSRYSIDFYKEFGLVPPMCGLVDKILSPKGVRRKESENYTSYHLHTDLIDIYHDEATVVEPGLYWILDIFKFGDKMIWCHYLFIVEDDGDVYPVAEFLKQVDSTWIPNAMPILKKYFNGEKISPIKLTRIRRPEPKKTRWNQVKG